MILLEFDKAGAEWVVVAYLSGDPTMIDVVESGRSPHIVTAMRFTGLSEDVILKEHKLVGNQTDADAIKRLREPLVASLVTSRMSLPRTMSIRQMGKKSNHGLNYREGYRMFALTNEIEEVEARPYVQAYSTEVYPGVARWWEAIDNQLRKDRTLTNCFGRKIRFLDDWGPELKKSATAFLPQSTVVDMVNQGMVAFYRDDSPIMQAADLLTQTHDSITLQYPTTDWIGMGAFAARMSEYLSPDIEYNHRKFRIGTDCKVGLDWGHMVGVPLVSDAQEMATILRNTFDEHLRGATVR